MWHNLESVMKLTMTELVQVNNITPEDCVDSELCVDVLLGSDSSGSHKQYAGKDIEIDSSNLEYGMCLKMCQITVLSQFTFCTFLGGVRPFLIETKDGTELWEQYSLGAESMRPYFILPGKESDEMMEAVCQKMDEEAKKTETFTIKIEDTEITVTVTWHLSLDGKLIDMSTGLSK